jgi:hypothetical protein
VYDSPVACTEFFAWLTDAVRTELLGVDLDSNIRRINPARSRVLGALGHPVTNMHVVESQARAVQMLGVLASSPSACAVFAGALRAHALLWVQGLDPAILQRCMDDPV